MNKLNRIMLCGAVILSLHSSFSFAFDVVITESEYRVLSDNCKRFYSVTQVGRTLGFTYKFSPNEHKDVTIDAERAGGAWHYCAGLVYMSRAVVAGNTERKQAIYKSALNEMNFTARKITEEHRLYGEVQLNLAKLYYFLGDISASRKLLQQLMYKMPDYVPVKIELSRQFAKDGQLQPAIDTLLSVSPPIREKSADLNYALGLYLYKSGQFEQSYMYAKKAYTLKYPLPWLRTQLKKKGYKF
jgi:hypothetical protein